MPGRASLRSAVAAFLALPVVVAGVGPYLLSRGAPHSGFRGVGGLLLTGGLVLLLWCVRDFYIAGRGTIAPWSPPRQLVVVGAYRVSRNPMYIGVMVICVGWAVWYPTRALWIYAAAVAVAFHLRVVFGEEPWLERTHGDLWTRYRARVRRWL